MRRILAVLALGLTLGSPAHAGEDVEDTYAGIVLERGSSQVVHWQLAVSKGGANASHDFIDFGPAGVYDAARMIAKVTPSSSWVQVFADFLNSQVNADAKTEWDSWSSTQKTDTQAALRLAAPSSCYGR